MMIFKKLQLVTPIAILCVSLFCQGCSSPTGPILPSGELTPEQLEKIKAEDRAIEDAESQGSVKN
jgi:hypothetical protein